MISTNKAIIGFIILFFAFLAVRPMLVKQPETEKQLRGENGLALTELDISVCDPSKGKFSSTIDNAYFPYPVGKVAVLESDAFKVQMTSLEKTEEVAGITTRVLEEREWENGKLVEVSQNYYAQAADGTVCYFGEAVDIYENDQIVSHEGSWRADKGENKPGIIMPAGPGVGQVYRQEVAPGIAEDRAEHTGLGESWTTPAGTFVDVLVVEETPPSTKRYARGIGLISDNGAELTKY